jgi:peptidoglycan/LPS O-acetylase OafA/YrhL
MRPPLPPSAARWRDDVPFLVFLATVPLCLLRAKDLPSVEVGPLDVTIADVFLAATALLALVRLRERRRLPAPWLLGAAFAFGALLVVTALPNGSDALTAAGKIAELGALTLGAALFPTPRSACARSSASSSSSPPSRRRGRSSAS